MKRRSARCLATMKCDPSLTGRSVMTVRAVLLLCLFPFLLVGRLAAAEAGVGDADQPKSGTQRSIDYANQIRPILADNCFACHGPDEESREADLRLDVADDAYLVIEPGDAEASELVTRLIETDESLVMPPPDSGKQLTAEQIKLLKQWIDEGAGYAKHWAFTPPKRPEVPDVALEQWVKNPVDAFVAEKLGEEELEPSPRATARTLVRRLSLDLLGLPPEPEFVDRWVKRLEEEGEAAYQSLVSEFLNSTHYGERWGRLWLDAARYADSDGYEKDKPRNAWFYRDWVVRSLNEDRPFDDFIIRQVAGDLLPDATQDDRVATGFLRNSMVNEEGGADPEQFRMEAMFDRMDAVGKSILGLTVQCAQCHTHKYDPLQQEEYYGLFACLNSTHDAIVSVYTEDEQRLRSQTLERIGKLEAQIRAKHPGWSGEMLAWASKAAEQPRPNWATLEMAFLDHSLSGSKFLLQDDGSYLCQSYAPTRFTPQGTGTYHGRRLTGLQLELIRHANLPRMGPGRSVDGTWALSELTVEVTLSGQPEKVIPVKFSRALADRSPEVAELKSRYDNKKDVKRVTGGVEFAIDGDETTAWTNEIDTPLANVDQVAWFELAEPIEIPEGQQATVVVRLAQRHGGWNSDDNQSFNVGRFKVSLTGDPIPQRPPLPPAVDRALASLKGYESTEALTPGWTDEQKQEIFAHWRTTLKDCDDLNEAINEAWEKHPLGTTQLTLSQREQPRTTSLLARGDFLSPVHEVQPHVPEFLHPMPNSDEPPRLRLARWMVDRESPTTARSIVNRIWQAYFGVGLVETSDDLGTQSAPPSHPELLDFLSVELMDSGWSQKHLHRLIVGSATYRQSSAVRAELVKRDPYNRLLARGARFRVPAETVRDITLAASGLLNPELGGPSVYPPAPAFLFSPPVSYGPKVWNVAEDGSRYRRALYTFRFRSVPYPMLENFDAVPGNLSCVRRSLSNTPMQALTSLNEPLFLECSIALAANAMRRFPAQTESEKDSAEGSEATSSPGQANPQTKNDGDRLRHVFRRCLQRDPDESELIVLREYLGGQRERLAAGELTAEQILTPGKLLDLSGLDPAELAAWSLLGRVVLNLDETITRE